MGPFALMDMLGLDVCHHILAYLDAQFGGRVQEAALLKELYGAGRLGAKSGHGFYDHPGHQHAPEVDALIEGKAGVRSAFTPERLMATLLNEAFLCVEEGIASVDDVDTACIAGLGMAVRVGDALVRMGPLAYADQLGLDRVLAQLQGFEASLGLRFRPAPILEQKVRSGLLGKASGRGFKDYL
jgi:3-hydroxyacyl-CoA dehydrogenase